MAGTAQAPSWALLDAPPEPFPVFQPLFPQPGVLHGVFVTQMQDSTLGLVELKDLSELPSLLLNPMSWEPSLPGFAVQVRDVSTGWGLPCACQHRDFPQVVAPGVPGKGSSIPELSVCAAG